MLFFAVYESFILVLSRL